MFYFSTYRPNLFKHLLLTNTDQTAAIAAAVVETTHRIGLFYQHFLVHEQRLTPNMYCWSCKTLVTTYWTHLRVNGILAKSCCQQKTN